MFIIGHASKYSRAGNKPALVLPGPPERAPVNMSWVCSECTFYNVNADFLVCEICLNRRVPPGFRDHAVTRSGSTWSYAAPLLEVVDNFGIPYGTVELQGSSGHVRNFGRNVSALLLWGIDSGKVKTVKIPDTVRIIGQAAFRLCAALVSVEIPSSVDTIGVWAFEGCIALEAVHFPEVSNIKCIPRDCFSGCSALRKVTIPSYIEEIGLAAFAGCDSLATVTLPLASMKRRSAIGALAFGRHHSGSGAVGPRFGPWDSIQHRRAKHSPSHTPPAPLCYNAAQATQGCWTLHGPATMAFFRQQCSYRPGPSYACRRFWNRSTSATSDACRRRIYGAWVLGQGTGGPPGL